MKIKYVNLLQRRKKNLQRAGLGGYKFLDNNFGYGGNNWTRILFIVFWIP